MSRKWLLFILIPALLLIGGYIGLQVFLRTNIHKEEKKTAFVNPDSLKIKDDTLGGKKVSALDLRPLFIERLQLLLKKSSNGLYNLSVGDLKVDVLASRVSLHNVMVSPDSKVLSALKSSGALPADVFTASFKDLFIEGINLDDAIHSKDMDYSLIRLVNPTIEITHQRTVKKPKSSGDFSQLFLQEMKKLSITKLVVEGGSIKVHDSQKGGNKKLEDVQVHMANILLDSNTRNEKGRFLFAKEARIDFRNFSTPTKDGIYNFKVAGVSVNASQKSITLKNVSLVSPLSREAFEKKKKFATEMYTLLLPAVTITGMDWWSAINEEEVVADAVATSGGKMAVYFDRSRPPINSMGKFPSQLLMKIPVKFSIDKVAIKDLNVSYEEHNPLSGENGIVYMDKAAMNITNVRNEAGHKGFMAIDGKALFMHKIPIHAAFRFDMDRYRLGDFSAAVRCSTPFDSSLVNSFSAPLAMMKLEKGILQSLDATITGNEQGASGEVTVLYNDLKVSVLEKNKDKAGLNKKHITSFLANVILLKDDNPKKGKAPRKEQTSFKRDPTGGFMMLVWKTILVGVLKTIGAPEKIATGK